MSRLLAFPLILGLLAFSVVGFFGCGGGTESGTQQISEKAAPDPESNPDLQKKGKQKARKSVQSDRTSDARD